MMAQIIKNIKNNENGAAILELALIMPVMLLIMVGAVDFGAVFARNLELVNAAKAGAQYALVVKPKQQDLTGISSTVKSNLGDTANDTTKVVVSMSCQCDYSASTCSAGCAGYESTYVTVTVSETYQTPFFNYDWFFSEFNLSETSTIQIK